MAFEGNLKACGAAEVIQFGALNQSTGVLTFYSKGDTISLSFEEGRITAAVAGKGGVELPLEEYLVKSGKITKEKFNEIKKKAEETKIPIDEILLREGILTHQELEEVIYFKIQEIVDEVLLWKEGKYRFEPGKALYVKSRFKVSVDPNALLLEGMRRIDEWPRIQATLNDPKEVFEKTEKPAVSVEMGPEEEKILSMIDGEKSLEELVETSGLGKFRTYQAIYNLLEMGAVRKKGKKKKEEKKKEKKRKKIRIPVEVIMNILAGIIFAASLFLRFQTFEIKTPEVPRSRVHQELERIENMLGQ